MTSPGKPLTRQRSPWMEVKEHTDIEVFLGAKVFHRRVADGTLFAIVAEEPEGWHLSISFRNHRRELTRYPHWDEIADARYKLLPDDITMAMLLPPPEEYVAVHDTTFHLHELRES